MMPKWRFAILPVLLLIAAGCQSQGKAITGVANFALVEDGLYRGGQPSYKGVQELKSKGVRTVIDLRDDRNPSEKLWVEDAGMAYVNIPSSAARVEPEKIATFLKKVDEAQKPIFVHCFHGRDRTGLEIAVYRMVFMNWPREAALKELYAYGYNWALFPGIARYVQSFDPQQFSRKRLADAKGG